MGPCTVVLSVSNWRLSGRFVGDLNHALGSDNMVIEGKLLFKRLRREKHVLSVPDDPDYSI